MANRVLSSLRSVLAVLAGYVVIALGTTLTFEVLLGGISYHTSSAGVLALASVGAFLSGLCGGLVAAGIAGRTPVLHAVGVLIPITLDTTYVIFSGISNDPIWFDLVGSGTLMAAAVLGGYLWGSASCAALEKQRG